MLKELAKAKAKNKEKIIESHRINGGSYGKEYNQQKYLRANEILQTKSHIERREKIQAFKQMQKEIPDIENDPEIIKLMDKQLVDDWSNITFHFQKAFQTTNDLRCDLAGPEVYEPNEHDDTRVKFFKGIFKEWKYRLTQLPDDILKKRKNEIVKMWYTLFALQPLFNGLNQNKLSSELTINLSKIVKALKVHNFQAAYTIYAEMSIGKSVWPIGITEYAIHWKFSADRIASEKVLHIFNSQPGKNAIIAIRRLINIYKEIHESLNEFHGKTN